jgi:hypothetical protein
MDQSELIKLQIKSLLIVHYVSTFSTLEKIIKQIFQEKIVIKEHKHKSKLYFAYGCMVGNDVYYDFENESLHLNGTRKYKDDELFNNLNINKIIKFDRKEHLIENFGITIDSVQTKNLSYTLHDVVIKLIEMRNVLAHEVDNIIFKEKHIVDNLSIECIKKYPYEWLEGLDVTRIDNESLAIYSNLIYMELVIKKLSS